MVVGVWTGSGFSSATDVNSDGAPKFHRPQLVVGAWAGSQNCAPCPDERESLSGGGGWAYVPGEAEIEVRPAGGGAVVDTLESGKEYEIHYLDLAHPAEAYILLVTATCAGAPISGVQPADSGDWASTGLFEYAGFDPASSEAMQLCGVGLDDRGAGGATDSTQAAICTFTAGEPCGLALRLSYVDEAGQPTYESVPSGISTSPSDHNKRSLISASPPSMLHSFGRRA